MSVTAGAFGRLAVTWTDPLNGMVRQASPSTRSRRWVRNRAPAATVQAVQRPPVGSASQPRVPASVTPSGSAYANCTSSSTSPVFAMVTRRSAMVSSSDQ
ncbi:hypothetical protein [Plantactinospora sp. KBS50]|uniref:hypothetical protein n=1 Tax=Plantactinospora sp. KBS50 TaxID=2024580 RepID=UPI001E51319B|nr:hypothetical protein [Plantactinospora sp. KBS50]